ncbi:MAG: PEP-CTERM sorting domain-containing protein [Planctomycetaceae bacterium]|jgi:hypothetical protein|nr:PEP-CTERM sorting domain-containing protein [Planctomycetaceae bacterium]
MENKMKILNLNVVCISFAMLLGVTISNIEIANAGTIYLGTGNPVYSGKNGTTKNVTGTVTDLGLDGLADALLDEGSYSSSDPTNTRDANWFTTYTDTFAAAGEYTEYYQNKASTTAKINGRRSALEESLKAHGSTALGYQQYATYGPHLPGTYVGSTGAAARADAVIYEASADLVGKIGMNQGGLSNFAVNGAGVLTTYGGGYFDEAGQYKYSADDSITYLGHDEGSTFGFMPVQSGIVAFTTGFTRDASTTAYNFINGTFAVLGELMGIYLNGTLLDPSKYFLSDDMITSGYAYSGQYQFEIDLSKFQDLLVAGNNNISFMVLGIPLDNTSLASYLYNNEISFINFSADMNQNTESIIGNPPPPPPSSTPEPATMLIVGLGIAGLGLRKKLMNKKSI